MLAQVLHPIPSLATAGVAVGFGLIFRLRLTDQRLAIIFVTVLMSQFSISCLNDWADRRRDAAEKRKRPVAMARLRPGFALGLAVVFGVLSLAGAVTLGPRSVLIVILALAAGWCYDLVLKPTPWSFVPFAVAFPLLVVWVALAAGQQLHSVTLLFLGGVPLSIAIHLADAIPDRVADEASGLRTPAVLLPYPAAELVAGFLLLSGIAVTYVALSRAGRLSWPWFSPISLAAVYFVLAFGHSFRHPGLARLIAKWALVGDAALVGLVLALIAAYG